MKCVQTLPQVTAYSRSVQFTALVTKQLSSQNWTCYYSLVLIREHNVHVLSNCFISMFYKRFQRGVINTIIFLYIKNQRDATWQYVY